MPTSPELLRARREQAAREQCDLLFGRHLEVEVVYPRHEGVSGVVLGRGITVHRNWIRSLTSRGLAREVSRRGRGAEGLWIRLRRNLTR